MLFGRAILTMMRSLAAGGFPIHYDPGVRIVIES